MRIAVLAGGVMSSAHAMENMDDRSMASVRADLDLGAQGRAIAIAQVERLMVSTEFQRRMAEGSRRMPVVPERSRVSVAPSAPTPARALMTAVPLPLPLPVKREPCDHLHR